MVGGYGDRDDCRRPYRTFCGPPAYSPTGMAGGLCLLYCDGDNTAHAGSSRPVAAAVSDGNPPPAANLKRN